MVDGEEYNCSRNQFKNVLAFYKGEFIEPDNVVDYTATFTINGEVVVFSPANYTGELGIIEI